jgi:branched-chain amino acid transport system permease protein
MLSRLADLLNPLIGGQVLANGLLVGATYALIALGLTLVYGVLHIINFAHGALLTLALFAVLGVHLLLGLDPYVALLPLAAVFFVAGYVLQRLVIWPASRGSDQSILLVTLGISVVIENLLLAAFRADERGVNVAYAFDTVSVGGLALAKPRLVAALVSVLAALGLGLLLSRTDTGKAIRAVARERQGARLVGIDVENMFAVSYGIGIACLGAAACLLMPTFYVTPSSGHAFVLVAFTIVVLGGMGSFAGAAVGGFIIGVTESLGGLLLGEQLGQIGISLIFILILLLRPTGLFGSRA